MQKSGSASFRLSSVSTGHAELGNHIISKTPVMTLFYLYLLHLAQFAGPAFGCSCFCVNFRSDMYSMFEIVLVAWCGAECLLWLIACKSANCKFTPGNFIVKITGIRPVHVIKIMICETYSNITWQLFASQKTGRILCFVFYINWIKR